jgi:hypothetical protein
MLDKAFCKISDTFDLILHSDQGWQYQHKHYRHKLEHQGIIQSRGAYLPAAKSGRTDINAPQ